MPRPTPSQRWRAVARDALTLVVLLALAAGVIGILEYARDSRRTIYHGRSLAQWLTALESTHAGVRDTAAYALTRLVPALPTALPSVIRAESRVLGDPDEEVEREATAALITLGPGSDITVPTMIGVLARDPNPSARMHAAQVLGALGQRAGASIPVVIAALADSNASVRLVAVSALARIGLNTNQLDVVARVATDSDAAVRAAAIESMIALHAPAEILRTIGERAAHDPDAVVRVQAVYALATVLWRLGPDDRDATVALERAAADSDREVRAVASRTLRGVLRSERAP
jgi:HEAT repeat protein